LASVLPVDGTAFNVAPKPVQATAKVLGELELSKVPNFSARARTQICQASPQPRLHRALRAHVRRAAHQHQELVRHCRLGLASHVRGAPQGAP